MDDIFEIAKEIAPGFQLKYNKYYIGIGEVMHAILAYKNVPIEGFQRVRLEKLEERGGFKDRILLKEVMEVT